MKRVKIIEDCFETRFAQAVENFIRDHNVLDTQFSPVCNERGMIKYLVMIVYEG